MAAFRGMSLSHVVAAADSFPQVAKMNLRKGDCMLVKTYNSLYTMKVMGDGWFEVSGGWFDRKGVSPYKVRIHGCTWGGSAIKIDIAAGCGLCLEFGNRVVTSPIMKIVLLQNGIQN